MMVARIPSVKRRIVSCTMRYRLTPPLACSIRILRDESARLVAFARGVSAPPRGGVLGLNDGHPLSRPPLPPHLWIATTPGGQGIASQLCHALIRGLAFTGGAQAPTGTGFVAAQPVVARGARLLPAGIVLWRRGICRARARPFGPLRPTRGDGDSPVARTVLRRAATSPAGRAGSRACWAQARFNTAWRR